MPPRARSRLSIRILLVDDHAIVRQGLRRLLETRPGLSIVGEAGDGEEALARARELSPDVVLLDISMPRMDGIEAARRLRRLKPKIRILIFSMNDDEGHVVEAFQAGADGYVLKDGAPGSIAEAIEAVYRGETYCSEAVRRHLGKAKSRRRPEAEPPPLDRCLFSDADRYDVRNVVLRATDEPQSQREKLAKIVLDEMYQFVALLDIRGRVLEVNRAALEGGGLTPKDVEGKDFWDCYWWTVSRRTQDECREAVLAAARGQFIRHDVEIFGEAGGKKTIVIDFSIIPVRDAGGKVVFLVPEGRNITEKKAAEAEISRKNEELQKLLDRVSELDALKTRFFANISHELRTPLALILGPAEKWLARGAGVSAELGRDLEIVRRNAAMVLKHVNDLLDLSKLEAGKMTVGYARADLAKLARATAGNFDALAPSRNIAFSVSAPDTLSVELDPEKIERVLLNLLSNAFKFTPSGGRINLEVSALAGERALIAVKDSGPGVKPEERPRIFERFRQGDAGTDRRYGGTGLGLSIVKEFVDLHRGAVSVTEAPGGGALFQVELPLRAPAGTRVRRRGEPSGEGERQAVRGVLEGLAEPGQAIRPGGGTADLGRPLVLVVEDNAELNQFLLETLSAEFRVETAADGREGAEMARKLRPDVILTDIMMPMKAGDQLVFELRQDAPELERTPIIVLSARADDPLRIRLLENGAQDFMIKPFSAQELLSRVRNLASAKLAGDALLECRATLDQALAQRTAELKALAGSLVETEQRERRRLADILHDSLQQALVAAGLHVDLILGKSSDADVRDSAATAAAILKEATESMRSLTYELCPPDVASGGLGQSMRWLARQMQNRHKLAIEVVADRKSPPLTDAIREFVLRSARELLFNVVKHARAGEAVVRVSVADSSLRLEVSDDGAGFDAAGPRAGGLGLTRIGERVKALGGRLAIDSRPGGGCRIELVVPLSDGCRER